MQGVRATKRLFGCLVLAAGLLFWRGADVGLQVAMVSYSSIQVDGIDQKITTTIKSINSRALSSAPCLLSLLF